ncbi:MAG: hypothetical protein M3R17_12990 [Bacteroidota bacterium]|nr:hypothetical protein [Bacteroidota bacterium]
MTETNSIDLNEKFEKLISELKNHELLILHDTVVARIKLINKASALVSMSRLKIGDRVSWDGSDGEKHEGIIIRLNNKTASVKVSNEYYWKVSPQLLSKEN